MVDVVRRLQISLLPYLITRLFLPRPSELRGEEGPQYRNRPRHEMPITELVCLRRRVSEVRYTTVVGGISTVTHWIRHQKVTILGR